MFASETICIAFDNQPLKHEQNLGIGRDTEVIVYDDNAVSVQLIDARSEKEYLGLQVAEGQRPGTIPGARHLEWSDLVEPTTGRFRPTPDVLQLLKDRGIDLNRPIVAFSNNRSRSSSIAFPLELAGVIQTRVFETGIKSWGSDPSNPIATHKR